MDLTDSEAATLRAACEIAVDFWNGELRRHEDSPLPEYMVSMFTEQRDRHEAMRVRIVNECGV